jgi:hypothetical protein
MRPHPRRSVVQLSVAMQLSPLNRTTQGPSRTSQPPQEAQPGCKNELSGVAQAARSALKECLHEAVLRAEAVAERWEEYNGVPPTKPLCLVLRV